MGVSEGARHDEPRLSTGLQRRELLASLEDPSRLLALLRRELPRLANGPIRVNACSVKPSKSRKSIRAGRLDLAVRVELEVEGEAREYVLLGAAPVTPAFLEEHALERLRHRGHPWAAPFRELGLHVAELELALLFFPLDPALPALAEVTGSEGARVLGACLSAGRAEAGVERPASVTIAGCELVHYKPFDRAVLGVRVALQSPRGVTSERTVYAKLFADDHGAECFRTLTALWRATRGTTCLRVPEPLGYDAAHRMLLMAEAPGRRDLTEWIGRLENGEPLPAGVDLERLKRCALVAARALQELQASDVRPELRRTFAHELARVRKDGDLLLPDLHLAQPELAMRAAALIERLEGLAPAKERLVPAHGGYRHKQMIGDELTLTLIDWDGISLANPALDAATFLARLMREPRRRPGSAPELVQMAATFRRAFLERQPVLERDLDLHEALVLAEQLLRALRRGGDAAEMAREIRFLCAAASGLLEKVELRSTGNGR